jgi:hypothetical protein
MFGFLERMASAFTSAYNTGAGSNIRKVLSIIAYGYEQIYTAMSRVDDFRDLDNAAGKTLDKAGGNVNISRNGMNDNLYRAYIKNKLMSSVSGSDVDTVIECIASLFSISEYEVDLEEDTPAHVTITVPEEAVLSIGGSYSDRAESARQFVKNILSAGIGVDVILVSTPHTSATVVVGGAAVEETLIVAQNETEE